MSRLKDMLLEAIYLEFEESMVGVDDCPPERKLAEALAGECKPALPEPTSETPLPF